MEVSVLKEHREISLRLHLEPGSYIIIPSCRHPGSEGEFFLSLYFDIDESMINTKRLNGPQEKATSIAEETEVYKDNAFTSKIVS